MSPCHGAATRLEITHVTEHGDWHREATRTARRRATGAGADQAKLSERGTAAHAKQRGRQLRRSAADSSRVACESPDAVARVGRQRRTRVRPLQLILEGASRLFSSRLCQQPVEQPAWADDRASDLPHPLRECAVRGHQRGRLAGRGGFRRDRVVAFPHRVHDAHAVRRTLGNSSACSAFQDDDDRRLQLAGAYGGPQPVMQVTSRPGPVPPPTGGSGSDDVSGVNEQHDPIIRARSGSRPTGAVAVDGSAGPRVVHRLTGTDHQTVSPRRHRRPLTYSRECP